MKYHGKQIILENNPEGKTCNIKLKVVDKGKWYMGLCMGYMVKKEMPLSSLRNQCT